MSHDLPAPGTFFRPVGPYGYCLEVVKIVPINYGGGYHWTMRRWGMKDGQPFDDGHKALCYHNQMIRALPDAWKEPRGPWDLWVMYYRRITLTPEASGGQMNLF